MSKELRILAIEILSSELFAGNSFFHEDVRETVRQAYRDMAEKRLSGLVNQQTTLAQSDEEIAKAMFSSSVIADARALLEAPLMDKPQSHAEFAAHLAPLVTPREVSRYQIVVKDTEAYLAREIARHVEAHTAQWLPIESAPRDGTMILVCMPRMSNLIVRARYNTIHKYWLTDYEGEGGIKQPHYFHPGDLWQPMPAAPANDNQPKSKAA